MLERSMERFSLKLKFNIIFSGFGLIGCYRYRHKHMINVFFKSLQCVTYINIGLINKGLLFWPIICLSALPCFSTLFDFILCKHVFLITSSALTFMRPGREIRFLQISIHPSRKILKFFSFACRVFYELLLLDTFIDLITSL